MRAMKSKKTKNFQISDRRSPPKSQTCCFACNSAISPQNLAASLTVRARSQASRCKVDDCYSVCLMNFTYADIEGLRDVIIMGQWVLEVVVVVVVVVVVGVGHWSGRCDGANRNN
jgi:hypothetical protein